MKKIRKESNDSKKKSNNNKELDKKQFDSVLEVMLKTPPEPKNKKK